MTECTAFLATLDAATRRSAYAWARYYVGHHGAAAGDVLTRASDTMLNRGNERLALEFAGAAAIVTGR